MGYHPLHEPSPIGGTMLSFIHEAEDEYQAKAGEYLTSHLLNLYRYSPWHYRERLIGMEVPPVKSYFIFGSALHALILEGGEVLRERFTVGEPINPTTGKPYGENTQKYQLWLKEQTKPTITNEQLELLHLMEASFRSHREASALLRGGVAEGTLREDYAGMRCQARIDYYNPCRGIIDIKSCDNLNSFAERARNQYRYYYQMAFYHALIQLAHERQGISAGALNCFLVAGEKAWPYRWGVWVIDEELLANAKAENETAIEQLKQSLAEDKWPTGYEEVRFLS